ncbi:MAG: hypothetical protein FJ108_15155 [Deltaproteobacteria bacterium]|nr:hypothetical protein [Deltaproteobacteria bacterium]
MRFARARATRARAWWAGLVVAFLALDASAAPLPRFSAWTPLAGDVHRHAGSADSHLKLAAGVCSEGGTGDPHERGLNVAVYAALRTAGYDWGNLSYHDFAISSGEQSRTYRDWIAPGPARGVDETFGYQVIPSTAGFPDWTRCGSGAPADQPCAGSTGANEALSHSTAAELANARGVFAAFSGREYTNGVSLHTIAIPAGPTDTICGLDRDASNPSSPLPLADRCANEGELYAWIHRSAAEHGGGDGVLIRAHPEDPAQPGAWSWHPVYLPGGFSDRSIYGIEVGRQFAVGATWEATFQKYIARGYRLFPAYGSDAHRLHHDRVGCYGDERPQLGTGATICWADAAAGAWGRPELIDAMRERRCYYSSAFEPRLELEACNTAASPACVAMGGNLDSPDGRVRVKVRATNDPRSQGALASPQRRLAHVELVSHAGAVLRSCTSCCSRRDATGDVCEVDFSAVSPSAAGGAVYVRICSGTAACGADADSTALISAPVFVNWSAFRDSVGHEGDGSYDTDADGIEAQRDNCPALANPAQENFDHDAFGDACDLDCRSSAADADGDGHYECARCLGASGDSDGDRLPDACDNCPTVPNGPAQAAMAGLGNQLDRDGDGIGDACDNCVVDPNPEAIPLPGRTTTGGQLDDDADGYGNACDPDFDNDGRVQTSAYSELLASHGRRVTSDECGASGTVPCERFDFDGRDLSIGGCAFNCSDSTAFFRLTLDPTTGAYRAPPRLGPKCADCGVRFDALPCAGDACDPDGDGVLHASDNCPFTANPQQEDTDGDRVGDACDSCTLVPNRRVPAGFLAANPWATLTGGQRDDDADGYGNICDAKFPGSTGLLVSTPDLREMRASTGKARAARNCGTDADAPCAAFDLNEGGSMIATSDLVRFRELSSRQPGPRCASCPLACAAGSAAVCPAAASP